MFIQKKYDTLFRKYLLNNILFNIILFKKNVFI